MITSVLKCVGDLFSYLRYFLFGPKEFRVLFAGSEGTGTVIQLLQHYKNYQEYQGDRPNYSLIIHNYIHIWAINGLWRLRYTGKHNLNAIVFYCAMSKGEVSEKCKNEMQYILNEPAFDGVRILVLKNVPENKGGVSPDEVSEKLGLQGQVDREWFIQPFSRRYWILLSQTLNRLEYSINGEGNLSDFSKVNHP